MKTYWVIIWLINQSKVLVISQAPGDQDNFCTTLSDSITPPSYPPNSIILMDSYNYIRLLPSAAFPNEGVWQQVDVDGVTDVENNNAPTNWLQPTSSSCREAVSSCYFNLAPPSQNNWLITQHISREVNGSLLPQVSVQVEFQLTGCEAGCQRSFPLDVWETSNIDPAAARNTTQYRRIQRVAPNSDSGLLSQNASIPVTFNTNETGFYLGFVDDNTCIAITRIIVFYYVCPAMVQDFIIYPETLSPPIDSLQPQTRQVQGQCVEGAEGQLSGNNPSLQCVQAGKWSTLQMGTGCQCRNGFFAIDDDQGCTSCPAGEYMSPVNNFCQACPANTKVDVFGVAACPCLNGYYRAPEENGDFACTQPPGMPTNIMVRREGATAFVSWTAPANLGGRTDIFYRIWYEPQGGERMASEPIYNATMGTITGLQPNRKYRIYVSAENGVSEVASSTTEVVLGLDEFTTNSTPLIVGIVIAMLAVIIILSLIIIFVVVLLLKTRRKHIRIKKIFDTTEMDDVTTSSLQTSSNKLKQDEELGQEIFDTTEVDNVTTSSLQISSNELKQDEELGQEIFDTTEMDNVMTSSLQTSSNKLKQDEELGQGDSLDMKTSIDAPVIEISLLIPAKQLELHDAFGQGEFGIVYRGSLKSPIVEVIQTVAVKTIKGFVNKDLSHNLLQECIKMKDFDHPNVLKLIGVCLDGGPAPYIIMPYMVNGDLLSYLKKKRSELVIPDGSRDSVDLISLRKRLLDMFHQVGKGMEYLASKRVIHRDLAARNCMIDLNFVIKVADFGLAESLNVAKDYYRVNEEKAIKLPIKWMSPESIQDNVFSEKSDVWSYGISLWEICTGGQSPYPGIHPMELPKLLQSGHRMEIPPNKACSKDMYELMTNCWKDDPAQRPSFNEIVALVSTMMLQLVDYLKLQPDKESACN